MAFDPDKFISGEPSFDPDAFAAEKDAPSIGESVLRGGAQGATLGFADELTGAIEAGADKLSGSDERLAELYARHRDESRKHYDAAKKANPKSYMGGEFAGGAASLALLPEVATVKGAAAVGAGIGATSALGGSEDDLSTNEGQLSTAKQMALQAIIGGTLGAAGKAVADKFNPSELEATAERRAAKAAGAMKSDFMKLGDDKLREAGRVALDTDIIRPGLSGTDDMMARNEGVQNIAGETIGNTMEVIDDAGLKVYRPKNALDSFLAEAPDVRDPALRPLRGKVEDMTDSLARKDRYRMSTMKSAQEHKDLLSDLAYGEKATLQPGQKVTDLARRSVSDEMERATAEGANQLGDENLLNDYLEAKRVYGGTKTLDRLLGKRQAGELGNQGAGLPELGAATATAAATGNPMAAVEAGGGLKLLKRFGNQNVAWGADRIAKTLQFVADKAPANVVSTLQNAAQRGPQAFAVAHYLMQQQSPEYSDALKKMGDQEP
jgi:hypothetical protein